MPFVIRLLYNTKHNTNIHAPGGIRTRNSSSERLQTHALDRSAIGIGHRTTNPVFTSLLLMTLQGLSYRSFLLLVQSWMQMNSTIWHGRQGKQLYRHQSDSCCCCSNGLAAVVLVSLTSSFQTASDLLSTAPSIFIFS